MRLSLYICIYIYIYMYVYVAPRAEEHVHLFNGGRIDDHQEQWWWGIEGRVCRRGEFLRHRRRLADCRGAPAGAGVGARAPTRPAATATTAGSADRGLLERRPPGPQPRARPIALRDARARRHTRSAHSMAPLAKDVGDDPEPLQRWRPCGHGGECMAANARY